jgi:hypothetical protein
MLIGVYLCSSAAINFFKLPDGLIDTTGLCIRDGMRRPVPQGRGCFRIPIDALDEVQKETGL